MATTGADWRARRALRRSQDDATLWRFNRAVARVHVVDAIVAGYATSYWGRPVRRRVVQPLASAVEVAGVRWSIEDEVVVEFLPTDGGPDRLVVYELALVAPIKKQLRTRHVSIERPVTMDVNAR